MLLTITTTHQPATDMGYLLGKHPNRCQTFDFPWAKAHVFYPEASHERCTIALAVELLTHKLNPNNRGTAHSRQEHFVNDRAYAATSHLALVINQLFSQAYASQNKDKPELSNTPLPLEVWLPTVPRGRHPDTASQLFEPLGYTVAAKPLPLDQKKPDSGYSRHIDLTLSHTITMAEMLRHLYVLLPTMDGGKHHYIEQDDVEKLMRFGEGWLSTHPKRDMIVNSSMNEKRSFANKVVAMLDEQNQAQEQPDENSPQETRHERQEAHVERGIGLNKMRRDAVLKAVKDSSPNSVIDLGCGEGTLTLALLQENPSFRVTAMDVSTRAMSTLERRAGRLTPAQKDRLKTFHGSLSYRDRRLADHDTAVAMEVVEHIDEEKLSSFEDTVLAGARPKTLIVTTPNREYNAVFGMEPGTRRHRDHRFEWDRQEFKKWANDSAAAHGYSVAILPIGPVDPSMGPPSQMAVFTRISPAATANGASPAQQQANPASIYH